MFQAVLLECFYKIETERSKSSIFHLLRGKRSSQTIQDAKAFHLSQYFGIYKSLTRNAFDEEIKQMLTLHILTTGDNDSILVTPEGIQLLKDYQKRMPELGWLNGFNLQHSASDFWQRLLLFIQTGSNMLNNRSHFIPVLDHAEIMKWVKRYYQNHKEELTSLFQDIYHEVYQLLKEHQQFHAEVIVARMTGYQKIGLSKQQISPKYELSIHDVEIYLKASMHFMVDTVNKNQERFPRLHEFIPEELNQLPLTTSAKKTYYWFKSGYTPEQIAQKRGLKRNTIYDHLIEIAIVDPSFAIHSFVKEDEEIIILNTVQRLNTQRLKAIKDELPSEIDYFQIRLVLAKHNQMRSKVNEYVK
ncbi:helix-turn-helix domain-containing protein [Salinibacillus xinjiangensis]|uniref:Helicase Helix-turn-helix domain-containing protein n=1 Tax=Salinibacillus xinjiangensis TaxID=1229268 RepID=A0A6G1X6D3_9BACI|nr:helix-turn-helix domain-containing protein [Salinibacillus xinjiangensis]MRG86440.1 hypothetical protein [Salinibacillus xinjiangensis]